MSKDHFYTHPPRRVTITHIVSLAVFVLLSLASFLWYNEQKQQFPIMSTGFYAGYLDGLLPQKRIPVIFERVAADRLFIIPFAEGATSSEITLTPRSRDMNLSEGMHPVIYSSNGMQLRFIGEKKGELYSGEVQDIVGKRTGTWIVSPELIQISDMNLSQLAREWIALRSQLNQLQEEIAEMNVDLADKKDEEKKIALFMNDSKSLRANADKKYAAELQDLAGAKKKAAQRTSEMNTLRMQVSLAQELSPRGRLTSLARQISHKEEKWFLSEVYAR